MNDLDKELMAEAVDRLPDQQREVINGLFYERASYRAMAARMGVRLHEVEKLRRDALDSLRRLIEEDSE